MSSPSITAEASASVPGAGVAEPHRIASPRPASKVDSGQPIVEIPLLIEPVAELTGGRRPPRRTFLASVPPAQAAATPARIAPLEIPLLIEPVAAPAGPPEAPPEPAPVRPPFSPRLAGWLAMARAGLPATRRARLAAAGIVVALGLLVIAAGVLGFGPFARGRHYPTEGAPSDPAARLAYFQDGARAGDANAELQLAILYAKGESVKQDYATAATWFRAAAEQGLARAQYDTGVLYERGRGVKIDLAEAANWYLRAAQGGYPLAQYNLAVCYTKGQGIRQDLSEAALWYRRAATQGVVQAMVNLGMMYEKGEGIAASPVDAYAWYRAGGRRDNQTAARRAEDLFASLPHLDQIRAEALASDVAGSIHDPERGDGSGAAGSAGH